MNNQPSSHISGSAWLMLLGLGLLWGGSFFFAGVAVKHIPPFTLAFLRFIQVERER